MRGVFPVLLLALAATSAGCGSEPICNPGVRTACFLADGTLGADTCNGDGTAQSGCAALPEGESLGCADVAASCCPSLPESMAAGCAAVVAEKNEATCNGYMNTANAVSLCTGAAGLTPPAYGPSCLGLMNGCCAALPSQMQSECFSHGFLGNEERCHSYLELEAKERGHCAEVDDSGEVCAYAASSCCPTLPAGPRERCEALAAEGDADQCLQYLGQLAQGNHCPTIGTTGPQSSGACDGLLDSCCSTLDGSLATQCDLTGLSGQPTLCNGFLDSLMASGACLGGGSTSSGGCGDTSSALDNCGFCGNVCGTQHATPSCAAGQCSLACALSFGDCDLDAANGCETDLTGDPESCGFCGKACSDNHGQPSCESGTCVIACKAGYDDCDADPGNGCESHLAASSSNCGACGNDCLGGPCEGGVCGPGATPIATGFTVPSALAVDASSIYLVGAQPLGGVAVQVPTGAGNVVCLESSLPPEQGTCGFGIFDGVVVSGGEVFFTSSSGVQRYTPASGVTAVVSSSVAQPWALAVDADFVFFTSRSIGGVHRVARGATAAEAEEITGAPTLVGGALVADLDYLYWTTPDGAVLRMHEDGSELQQIASAQAFDDDHLTPQYLAVDDAHLFWSSTSGRLFRIDKDGANLEVLVDDLSEPSAIAVDPGSDGRVYWVDRGAGTVQSIAKDGTDPKTHAAGQSQPLVIALDDTFVYWATLQGSVLKMAR